MAPDCTPSGRGCGTLTTLFPQTCPQLRVSGATLPETVVLLPHSSGLDSENFATFAEAISSSILPPSLRLKPELATEKAGGRTTSSVDRGKVIDTKKASYAPVTSSLIMGEAGQPSSRVKTDVAREVAAFSNTSRPLCSYLPRDKYNITWPTSFTRDKTSRKWSSTTTGLRAPEAQAG